MGVICTATKNRMIAKVSSSISICSHNFYSVALIFRHLFSVGGCSLWGLFTAYIKSEQEFKPVLKFG